MELRTDFEYDSKDSQFFAQKINYLYEIICRKYRKLSLFAWVCEGFLLDCNFTLWVLSLNFLNVQFLSLCGSLGRRLGHFLKNWDSNSDYSWQKLLGYGWNIPYLQTYESEMTFNHNLLLSHSEFSHLCAKQMLSHTGCIFSQLLERASVWVCKFFPWESRASLGSCGVPAGPTPNLTWPDSSPISW